MIIAIILGGLFVNNYILQQFLGICPFLGVSNKMENAVGMGIAVTFVMTLTAAICFGVQQILVSLEIEYLATVAFILIIAALVQIIEMAIKKFSPSLYKAMGIFLPLITTNCAVLGVAILNMGKAEYGFLEATLNGFFSGLGFLLAIVLLAGIREKIGRSKIAKPFQGFPITLLAASAMAVAFYAVTTLAF